MHCGVFVRVCCAFCMLGNVPSTALGDSYLNLLKVEGLGYLFCGQLS